MYMYFYCAYTCTLIIIVLLCMCPLCMYMSVYVTPLYMYDIIVCIHVGGEALPSASLGWKSECLDHKTWSSVTRKG